MKIYLTQNKYCLVDRINYSHLNTIKWHAVLIENKWYARNSKIGYMHRYINKTPKNMFTDHINGDSLDNRKENLRAVTPEQNVLNSSIAKNNTSGVTGITWLKLQNSWQTRIRINYKNIFLGNFKLKKDAIEARKRAEKIYFKEYSRGCIVKTR